MCEAIVRMRAVPDPSSFAPGAVALPNVCNSLVYHSSTGRKRTYTSSIVVR